MRHDLLPRARDVPPPPTGLLRIARRPAALLLRGWYDVRVHGAEHVPARGPVVPTCNHIGLFDGPLLTAFLPRPVHALVKREMFEPRGGWTFRAPGQIPVECAVVDPSAVKQAVRVLRDGGVVAVYPEGTRGRGDVAHSRLGTAYLAMVSGEVVVPVAHLGTRLDGESVHATPARGSRLDLAFGAPLRPACPVVGWPRRQAEVRALAEGLRVRLAAHVQDAVRRTGRQLPGPPPDLAGDAAGRGGQEVGPQAQEQTL